MSVKTKQFWSRNDVRLAASAVVLATLGASLGAAIVWGGLMFWQRDFRRRFSNWYKWSILIGLLAAWQLEYPISTHLNVPPSWISALMLLVASIVALHGQKRQARAWTSWP